MKKLLFSFADLGSKASATKALEKAFEKAGADVVSVDADAKIRRKMGFKSRSVHVGFADSQTVVLLIKESGDVFQVKVNGRLTPITAQDSHDDAVKEIVAKLEAGRSAFQKKLAKAKAPVPKGMASTRKTRLVKLTEKRDSLKEAIADVRAQIEEAKAAKATA